MVAGTIELWRNYGGWIVPFRLFEAERRHAKRRPGEKTPSHGGFFFFFFSSFRVASFCREKNEKTKWHIPATIRIFVYAHGRRLCSNWFLHGSTTISYPQCSLTFLCERCLHRCREQSFAIRAYAISVVGIDVVSVHKLFAYRVVSTVSTDIVSSHTKYCRIADGITR